MDSIAARAFAIDASPATVHIISRQAAIRLANLGRGQYYLQSPGIGPCALLTPLFRRNRQYAYRMMGPLRTGRTWASANNPFPPLWVWVAGFFAWVRTAWSSWKLAPQPIRRVSGGWDIVIRNWGNRGYRGHRPVRHACALSSVMDASARYVGARMLHLEPRGAGEPTRLLRWKQTFRRYCVKGHWGPWAASRTSSATCWLFGIRGWKSP